MDDNRASRAEDIINRTYEQLLNTRNAQLRYMAELRRRRNSGIFTILTPDLIVQYNYAHRLLRSLRTGLPTEVCVEDGGVTCSDLSVLVVDTETSRGGTRPVLSGCPKNRFEAADGSDYLGSRIVDLLDRPLTVNERDVTINVRDAFAANIRTLNQLFDERYRMCEEQSIRLRNELANARRELAASRAAAGDAISRSVVERQIEDMRVKIARYELQIRLINEQTEAFNDMNVNSLDRNRRELERLSSHLTNEDNSEAIERLLRQLVDNRQAERKRVMAVLREIKHTAGADHERSRESSDSEELRVDVSSSTAENQDGYNKRFQNAVEAGVQHELAAKEREIEDRITREVDNRKSSVDSLLREKFEAELKHLTTELQNSFSEMVVAGIAQHLNESIRLATVTELPAVPLFSGGENGQVVNSVLDDIRNVKSSVFNIEKIDIVGVDVVQDSVLVRKIHNYLDYILRKVRDVYTFLNLQNVYLKTTAANAYQYYVPPLPSTVERTELFRRRINNIMETVEPEVKNNEQRLKRLLEEMRKNIQNVLLRFQRSARNTDSYKQGRKLAELHERAKKLAELYRTKRVDPIASMQRKEYELLRSERIVKRSTVRELQLSLRATSPEGNKSLVGQNEVASYVAQETIRKEQTLRNKLLREFTRLYVELANYTIRFTDEFDEWSKSVRPSALIESLRDYPNRLRSVLDEAGKVLDYRKSPEYFREGFTKLNV